MVDWALLMPSMASLVIVGVMGSIFIHILDRNTTPGYVSKRRQNAKKN